MAKQTRLFLTPAESAEKLRKTRARLPRTTSAERARPMEEMRASLASVGRKPFDAKATFSPDGPNDMGASSRRS